MAHKDIWNQPHIYIDDRLHIYNVYENVILKKKKNKKMFTTYSLKLLNFIITAKYHKQNYITTIHTLCISIPIMANIHRKKHLNCLLFQKGTYGDEGTFKKYIILFYFC